MCLHYAEEILVTDVGSSAGEMGKGWWMCRSAGGGGGPKAQGTKIYVCYGQVGLV